MIEVFRTNVDSYEMAASVVKAISNHFAGLESNFDLGDCDRILRVKSHDNFNPSDIAAFVSSLNVQIEVLSSELYT